MSLLIAVHRFFRRLSASPATLARGAVDPRQSRAESPARANVDVGLLSLDTLPPRKPLPPAPVDADDVDERESSSSSSAEFVE